MDVRIEYLGTIAAITALTAAAVEWVNDNVNLESWQCDGPTFYLEPRYAAGIGEAMAWDGLEVA